MIDWIGAVLLGVAIGLIVNILANVVPGIGRPSEEERGTWRRIRFWVMGAGVVLAYLTLFEPQNLILAPLSADLTRLLAPLYLAIFLLILVIDIETRRVPNAIVFPTTLLGLVAALLSSSGAFLSALLGGVAGFLLFLIIMMMRPGAMGAGDVKLAGMLGVLLGFPSILPALVTGVLAGGIGAFLLIAFRRTQLRATMAYAPYLVLGATVVLWQGPAIIRWWFW